MSYQSYSLPFLSFSRALFYLSLSLNYQLPQFRRYRGYAGY